MRKTKAPMTMTTVNKIKGVIKMNLRSKEKSKTKFYFSDLANVLGLKPREAKKYINKMVQDEILEYWSSGSTTLYSLKGAGKQAEAENEIEKCPPCKYNTGECEHPRKDLWAFFIYPNPDCKAATTEED